MSGTLTDYISFVFPYTKAETVNAYTQLMNVNTALQCNDGISPKDIKLG